MSRFSRETRRMPSATRGLPAAGAPISKPFRPTRMDLMTSSRLRRWALVGALALTGGSFALWPVPPVSAAAAPDQVAAVQQLKTDAFKALKSGKFDVTNELLSRAATLSKDPADQKMASWTGSFESQRKE